MGLISELALLALFIAIPPLGLAVLLVILINK